MFRRMTIRSLFPALFLFAISVPPAFAAASPWTETPGGRIRLIVEDAATNDPGGGKGLRGALQIELKPGWKTYWRNPGDSGVPPQIDLDGGGKAQIAFPVPMRFTGEDAGGIGYKAPVSLPVTLTPAPGAARLTGHVFLGVCEKICVPVQAGFDLPLGQAGPQAEALAARTIVETAFDRLPAPASPAFGVSKAALDGGTATFDLALPDAAAPAAFFAASDGLSLSDPVATGHGRFTVKLQGAAKGTVVDYTIVQDGKAVSGQVTLD